MSYAKVAAPTELLSYQTNSLAPGADLGGFKAPQTRTIASSSRSKTLSIALSITIANPSPWRPLGYEATLAN